MIRGGCLCGGVRFEAVAAVGPFELCHCNRCRKSTGSAFAAYVGVLREDFRLLQGEELIRPYEMPLLSKPPPYRKCFCARCGSPVPDPESQSRWIEVAAGTLDDDPGIRPERHILVELKSPWFSICDELPQLDRAALNALRAKTSPQQIAGMTVNERLTHFGLLAEFEAAVKSRSLAAIEAVLVRAQLTPEQAHWTATTVLRAPERYGY